MLRRRASRTSSLRELVVVVVLAGLVAYGVQAWVVKPYQVPSASMEPTLTVGEHILVDRIGMHFGAPALGQIYVFHPPFDTASCAEPARSAPFTGGGGGGAGAGAGACDRVGSGPSKLTFVKRVVGLPGDHLRIINGAVLRNGHREPYGDAAGCAGLSVCNFPGTIVVPSGDYYVMGDNRADSEDSRFWGPVPRAWLIGRVFFAYWPLGRFGTI
ncbi:MAG TPA: signal peptidase I [Solirubrobacteraceae bacterium]|nr:signal peptidase I [Solirubrobacteraceae bacterium]